MNSTRQGQCDERWPPTRALLGLRAPIATALLVRICYGRAHRARPALRLSGGPVLCRLARRAVRRTGMHSLELGTVAPTCSLAVGSTSVVVSSIDYQVHATYYSHS